jgi:hypothetical protein
MKEEKNKFSLASFLKNNLALIIAIAVLLGLYLLDLAYKEGRFDLMEQLKKVASNFTESLSDESKLVSYILGLGFLNNSNNESIIFAYPTRNPATQTGEDYFVYNFAGMVFCAGEGKVKSINETEGLKYIEVQHAGGYSSFYVGIRFVGVNVGDSVGKGSPLGIVSTLNDLTFYVTKNNNKIKSSFITWEK